MKELKLYSLSSFNNVHNYIYIASKELFLNFVIEYISMAILWKNKFKHMIYKWITNKLYFIYIYPI